MKVNISDAPWPEQIEIAGWCCAPFVSIHALLLPYLQSMNTDIIAAPWRKCRATFIRLPDGTWGASVPTALAPRECFGDYAVDLYQKSGKRKRCRVRPMFTLRRWSVSIEICEIAS